MQITMPQFPLQASAHGLELPAIRQILTGSHVELHLDIFTASEDIRTLVSQVQPIMRQFHLQELVRGRVPRIFPGQSKLNRVQFRQQTFTASAVTLVSATLTVRIMPPYLLLELEAGQLHQT